jgi:hypothetical protein
MATVTPTLPTHLFATANITGSYTITFTEVATNPVVQAANLTMELYSGVTNVGPLSFGTGTVSGQTRTFTLAYNGVNTLTYNTDYNITYAASNALTDA